mgnify:FL=1
MLDLKQMQRELRLKEVRSLPWSKLTPAQRLARRAAQKRAGFADQEPLWWEPDITQEQAGEFYRSAEWHACRREFLQGKSLVCAACGDDLSGENRHRLNVDHFKPLRFFWEHRLDPANLHILCEQCNADKGNNYTDEHWIIRDNIKRRR